MSMTELYHSIISREHIPYGSLKARQKIAAVLPSDELDIMKIGSLGGITLDKMFRHEGGSKSELVAVAAVCPGQASVRLRSDGTVYLNKLVEVEWGLTPTGDQLTKNPFMVDYPGYAFEDVAEELGVLSRYRKAHWILLRMHPIVRVEKSEMRQIQEQIEKLYPELRER